MTRRPFGDTAVIVRKILLVGALVVVHQITILANDVIQDETKIPTV